LLPDAVTIPVCGRSLTAVRWAGGQLFASEGYDMLTASHLAGFLGAHAIWSVSDGETIVLMLGYTDHDDKRILNRLAGPELGASVAHGKEQLGANPTDANDAVLLYDGGITLGETKLDAIIIEIRAYFPPQSEVTLAIPRARSWFPDAAAA